MKKRLINLIAILGGIMFPCIYFPCLIIAIAAFPTLSPLHNLVSDVGSSNLNPTGAIWFNIGNILTGLCLVPFFIGFEIWYTGETQHNNYVKWVQAAGFLQALTLVMVGIYSEDFLMLHGIWSDLYFVSNFGIASFSYFAFRGQSQFPKLFSTYCLLIILLNSAHILSFGTAPILEWFAIYSVTFLKLLFLGFMVRTFRKGRLSRDSLYSGA